MALILSICFVSFVVGLYIGVKLANRGWKQNANEVMRMEIGGKLYKVIHGDRWKGE